MVYSLGENEDNVDKEIENVGLRKEGRNEDKKVERLKAQHLTN